MTSLGYMNAIPKPSSPTAMSSIYVRSDPGPPLDMKQGVGFGVAAWQPVIPSGAKKVSMSQKEQVTGDVAPTVRGSIIPSMLVLTVGTGLLAYALSGKRNS